jgi:hypothetical protein
METDYSLLIDRTDVGSVKRYFHSPTSEIGEVILLGNGADLAEMASLLDSDSETRRERGLALAERGEIRFAVDDPSIVPLPWTPYAVALAELDDERACWVIYAPPAYYVKLEGG